MLAPCPSELVKQKWEVHTSCLICRSAYCGDYWACTWSWNNNPAIWRRSMSDEWRATSSGPSRPHALSMKSRSWTLQVAGTGGSLGWWRSSSTASSSLPPRLPARLRCSWLWASPLCCEHPLSADFAWGAALCLPRGCWSPADYCPPKDAGARAATRLGVRRIRFLFFLFPPHLHNSCQLQPNCILFRQTVSGAMQMSFEMQRSGLYLSVNCLRGTDI